MTRKILISVITILFGVSALGLAQESQTFRDGQRKKREMFKQQQKQENDKYDKSVSGKPISEQTEAIVKQRRAQYEKRKAFEEQLHLSNMNFYKNRLSKNTKMTEAQKSELIEFMEKMYRQNVAFYEKQHEENLSFFEKVNKDASLTPEKKQDALKVYFAEQDSKRKQYLSQQHALRKAEQSKVHREGKKGE